MGVSRFRSGFLLIVAVLCDANACTLFTPVDTSRSDADGSDDVAPSDAANEQSVDASADQLITIDAPGADVAPPDGAPRSQDLTAGGLTLHAAMPVGPTVSSTGFLNIPAQAYASGDLVLSVNSRDAGSAVISLLVLKETGGGFSAAPAGTTRPTRYAVSQNYPNPFNPSTVIRYDIPEAGRVSLIVYDITGRAVVRLVDGVEPAGTYEVRFDATGARSGGLASGVYFYTIKAGNFSQTRKMIYVR